MAYDMKLNELENRDMQAGFYDPAQDQLNIRKPTDTRKPKLLLKDLNRLKKIRAMRKLEDLKRQELFGVMYDAGEEGGDMGGGMPSGF